MNPVTLRAKLLLCLLLLVCLLLGDAVRRRAVNAELQPTTPPAVATNDEESEDVRRVNAFYLQRAYPAQTIPRAARWQAIKQVAAAEAKRTGLRALSNDSAQQLSWASLGPAPIAQGQTFGTPRGAVSGRVSTIVLDPGYNGGSNQAVYLGAAQGGVWRSRDNGATWTPLTDEQPSLALGAIAINPTNPNILYAGTGEAHLSGNSYFGAGLLQSTDGGASWSQRTGPAQAFLDSAFQSLVIDPTAPATLYAATEFSSTFTASGFPNVPPLGNAGFWKSTDGGATWRDLKPAGDAREQPGSDILLDPRQPQRVFAAVRGLGIYRSTDAGATWEKLAGGLPASGFARIKLAAGPPLAPPMGSTLYAAFATSITATSFGDLLGIYRSTDNGATWTKLLNPPSVQTQLNYDLALAVDPVDANTLYYGASANPINTGGTLWRTRNGGATWSDISAGATGGLHADTHWIAISPTNRDTLFTANDGGIWRTDNATADAVVWTNLNATLGITQFYTIALHPTDPKFLLGGTQDNGTNRYDGNAVWFHARDGDGGAVVIDQSRPQVLYHTFFNSNNAFGFRPQIGPEISLDGGLTWARRGCFGCTVTVGNFHPADRVFQFAPMAAHPGFTGATGNVLYFGTHRLYRSTDQGVTWSGVDASADGFGADLTKAIPPNEFGYSPSAISAIAVHPALNQTTNPPGETVWIGAGDGTVQITNNAGAGAAVTFTNLTKAPLPNRYVADIALDPNNSRRAVVAYSGFNANTPATPGHLFATEDAGATWQEISGNLPDIPATSVVIDPLVPGALFAGTDLGVFQTTDGGATWNRLANRMPRVAVFALRYHAATRSLIAATHGRGVYRLQLPAAVANVSAASYLGATLARDSIIAAFGQNLATTTQVAASLPLPVELAVTRVTLRDRTGNEHAAPLFFVAPAQVNYLIPPGVADGYATITMTSDDGGVSTGAARIASVAPGLFAANANGQGVAAALAVRVKADGTQSFEPVARFDAAQGKYVAVPLDLGPSNELVVLVLFGTGFRNRRDGAEVSVRISGVEAPVQYAAAAPGFVGLDQLNVVVPRALIGSGEVTVALAVEGRAANLVAINVK